MIIFLLGLITGLIMSTTCYALVYILVTRNIARVKQVTNTLLSHVKKKGSLHEPESEDFTNWVDSLKNK